MLDNRLSGVSKIAVLRANAVGDFLFSLPALEALRHAYPDAEIVLLGRRWHAAFLDGRPGPVDRVEVVPAWRGVSEERTNEVPDRFLDRMRAERFDLALQLHGGGRNSNPLVRRLAARTTAGLKTPDAEALDRWVPYIYFQPEILRYLEVVSLVGALPVTLEPRVRLTDADRAEAGTLSAPTVLLNPNAGDGRRCWPAEKFAQVGDRLAAEGFEILVHGDARESSSVEAVSAAMRQPSRAVCASLSLGGLAALLAQCRLVVSNDSGPLHLAAAVGAPSVGIYWCGNLFTASPASRRLHRPCIGWSLNCPECGANCIETWCGHHASFVAGVGVEEVVGAARELLTLCSAGT